MNTCKNTINKISQLMVYGLGEARFKGDHLKSALKFHEILKKESIMRIKEKLLLKNRMEKGSDSICCPNCGLALPPYFLFCFSCGTQIFEDILSSSSKKSPTTFSKTFRNFFDFSFFLDNIKFLVFLLRVVKQESTTASAW